MKQGKIENNEKCKSVAPGRDRETSFNSILRSGKDVNELEDAAAGCMWFLNQLDSKTIHFMIQCALMSSLDVSALIRTWHQSSVTLTFRLLFCLLERSFTVYY